MKALRLTGTPAAPILRLEEIPTPSPGDNEVLIRVCAAAVTPTELGWSPTTHTREGAPRTGAVPGHEFSGIVAATGRNVATLDCRNSCVRHERLVRRRRFRRILPRAAGPSGAQARISQPRGRCYRSHQRPHRVAGLIRSCPPPAGRARPHPRRRRRCRPVRGPIGPSRRRPRDRHCLGCQSRPAARTWRRRTHRLPMPPASKTS